MLGAPINAAALEVGFIAVREVGSNRLDVDELGFGVALQLEDSRMHVCIPINRRAEQSLVVIMGIHGQSKTPLS
jgi:hypothetical protein